jgi:cation transport regulator ChaC
VRGALEKREAARERRAERRTVETPAGSLEAWAWVSRRSNRDGHAELETVEARLRAAHGAVGTGSEYVRTLVHAMELHGLRDPLIETLWHRLRD